MMAPSQAVGVRTGPQATAGLTVLFTGLPAAGKTTLATELVECAHAAGYRASMLDSDAFRAAFCPGLGYSVENRRANLRRAALVAAELAARR